MLGVTAFAAAGAVGLRRPPVARAGSVSPALTYQPGSTVKLEQVIGDVDYAAIARGSTVPTTSKTVSQCNVAGCDLGQSFEHDGKLLFLFGDTISNDPSMPWSSASPPLAQYRAGDCFGWSNSTDGESGLMVNLYTTPAGGPLFVQPPGVPMGPFDTPNAGISLNSQIYLVCNSGSDATQGNPHLHDYSVLARFDEASQQFATGRTISKLPGGHFVITSLYPTTDATGTPQVVIFGVGAYRASNVYLATVPAAGFESGAGTAYFTGIVNGQPAWSPNESDAAPVVQDVSNPPTIGNVSVVYDQSLSLWLMTFDGGRGRPNSNGIYFSYAPAPWGPWSPPQLIFNPVRENAIGDYISNYDAGQPAEPGTPAGPTIGQNDPHKTRGGDYAPYLIERFTNVSGSTLTIYFLMSTWNPYTTVKMRSQFSIS